MKRKIRMITRYIRRTFMNKVIALIIFMLGLFSAKLSNDGTFMLFTTFLSIPLFFERDNQIYY